MGQELKSIHLCAKGGWLAQVVTAKVLDHLPLQRQQKRYAREGVQLPVSTLAD